MFSFSSLLSVSQLPSISSHHPDMLRSPPVTSGLCCRSHVKLFPHHPSCLWTVDYQMLLATCSDPGFWRSASGLARTHRFVSQSILSVVCSSVTPSPAAAMALKPDSFSPLTPRLKLTSLLSSTSPAENLLNLDWAVVFHRKNFPSQVTRLLPSLPKYTTLQPTVKSDWSYNVTLQAWTWKDLLSISSVQTFLQVRTLSPV